MRIFIESIIRKAGNTALQHFKKSGLKYSHKKNIADVVTEADHASNKVLLNAIKKRYPAHGIISEETGEEHADAEYVWIIDPLDGTRNFLTHTPLWGVMVGLARNKQMIAAAIYDPNHNELTYAGRGKGAFLNGKRVYCSKTNTLPFSLGSTSSMMRADKLRMHLGLIRSIGNGEIWMSMFGTSALSAMYVSAGRRDWWLTSGGALWDYAPTSLILREAGCKVTNFKGTPWQIGDTQIIAANPILYKKLMKAIL